ncbi:MXAN_6640 family putative metalloprotease [Nocardioides cavernaquae]|uniref:Uncharacterized protein n=1 Tax=Nocardioides cavernaquae TaxID=2321396 RepID=A0A3A5HFV2_9ACTN|nr:MXAN_6640 family putative metalloprotease [Nocardioides cavernaquae]RJS46840.1 hypothetical protein D4739_11865 [Nocardioides cavernaquae]
MRRTRRSTPVRALALALPTAVLATPLALVPAYADPVAPPSPAGPPEVSAPAAEQALEDATALLTGVGDGATEGLGAATSGPTDATLALLELRKQLPQLSAADRRQARALMARPDGENGTANDTPLSATYGLLDGTPKSTCDNALVYGDHPFCVHWIDNAGSRHYATAAEVTETVTTMQRVWDAEISGLHYKTPILDGARGGTADGRLDVYLADIAGSDAGNDPYDYFGYAVPEDDPKESAGYLVLENDFTEFVNSGTSATEFRQVTAAHEFFHIVQFGYDSYEDGWLMESTATWMEEQVYPSVNDSRNYIRLGSLRQPHLPLDTRNGGAEYGTWVFHELYTRSLGDTVVRRVWEQAAATGVNYRGALSTALSNAGWSLTTAFRTFGGSSLAPRLFYAEGAAYPSAQLSRSWKLTRSARSTGTRSIRLAHLAGAAYDFRPGGTLTGRWNLRLAINAPAGASTAYAVVFFSNGTAPRRIPVALDRYGNKTFSVPFRAGTVQRVALHLGNASSVNGRTTTFKATAWR